ncbi:hypothetical protein CRUP_021788 [Coryphaenoides rupestris]|nr:hypothetical protein CRUP_021788 [Coryphaenoides rupestris]
MDSDDATKKKISYMQGSVHRLQGPPTPPPRPLRPPSPPLPSRRLNNTTLLFEGVDGLRYCSCQAPVRHWDESVANLQCSCRSIPHSTPPPAGLGEPAAVRGTAGGRKVLALLGLRTLCIHSSTPRVPYPNQELAIASPNSRSSSSSEVEVAMGEGADRGLLYSPPPDLPGRIAAQRAVGPQGVQLDGLVAVHLGRAVPPSAPGGTTSTGPGGSPGSHDQVRDPHSECHLTFVY